MATMAELLMQSQLKNSAMDRRSSIAESLLASSQRTTSPLVAALGGFLGAYQLKNLADEQGQLEKQLMQQMGSQPTAPFEGTGMTAQAYNILLNPAKRGTPEYQAALAYAGQPKTQVQADGSIVTIKPDLSWVNQGGQPTGQPMGQPITGQSPAGNPNVTITEGGLATAADKSKLKQAEVEAKGLLSALDSFGAAIDGATNADFLSALGGGVTEGGTKLNNAWTNAALLAKGEALYNLGVLSGPDLSIIQKALADPSTIRGSVTTKEAYKEQIKGIKQTVQNKIDNYRQLYGNQPQEAAPNEFIDMPNAPATLQPAPEMQRVNTVQTLKSKGFTAQEIKDYMKAKGM
jgi:hypothetical protein